jgi:acyl-CoA thioesterase FadM
MLRETSLGVAAVENVLNYKRELMAGDVIEIRTRILDLADRKVRFRHEMINRGREIAATSELLGVMFRPAGAQGMRVSAGSIAEGAERTRRRARSVR